jgi:hypothetical protein
MQNGQPKKFFQCAPWRGLKKAPWHIRGVKQKNFSNPLMMVIKKRRILCRFQKYKLVLATKCPYNE